MKTLPPVLKGRKASETFMEFIKPYLGYIMSDGSVSAPEQIEIALQLPWCIWNAIEFDKQDSKTENKFMKLLMSHMPAYAKKMASELKERKGRLFNQYNYIIGEYSISMDEKNDEIKLWVEAKLPPKI